MFRVYILHRLMDHRPFCFLNSKPHCRYTRYYSWVFYKLKKKREKNSIQFTSKYVQLQIERSVILNWHEKHMAFYLCVAGVEYKHMAFIQHLFCRLSQSIHLLFINENSIELMFTTHTHTHTRDTERWN
jgi:hypothetical protein